MCNERRKYSRFFRYFGRTPNRVQLLKNESYTIFFCQKIREEEEEFEEEEEEKNTKHQNDS